MTLIVSADVLKICSYVLFFFFNAEQPASLLWVTFHLSVRYSLGSSENKLCCNHPSGLKDTESKGIVTPLFSWNSMVYTPN